MTIRRRNAALDATNAWRGYDVVEINNNAGYMPHYLQASRESVAHGPCET
jgi:hypothetical protein